MNTAFCAEVARAGEPCLPEQCDSRSICAFSEAEGMDAALCYGVCPNGLAEECPANHDCIDAGLAAPVCIPLAGFRSEGESCQDNAECESGICRVIGDARLCTSNCSTTEADACGPGLVCVPPTGSTQGLCWPRSLSDELRADQERAPTPLPDYCACDITSACDADCDCDPECSGGCRHAAATPASTPRWGVGLAVLGAAGLWARRRRSFSSGRGRRRSAGSGGTG
jgi:MYXO-CTERM domain-containing protein